MSETNKPPTLLASGLLGWAFGARGAAVIIVVLAAICAAAVTLEFAHPRFGLRLPLEAQPGFYAAVGAGAISAALLVSAALRWLLLRDDPYTDEMERERVDGDHA